MLRQAIVFLLFLPQLVFAQKSDLPFQVLVAENAYVFGKKIEPLTFVDDVTSIDVKDNGFIALVHKGGTSYEVTEKIFTFYLKAEELKDLEERPDLSILYRDEPLADLTETITLLYPIANDTGLIKWEAKTPFEMYWHLPDEPVVSYKITISDHNGEKIQDYGTTKHQFVMKPYNLGLDESRFIFQISSSFAGEITRSKHYIIDLTEAPTYPIKASDLVVKAASLELSPVTALEVWKEALGMDNGKYYFKLFEKFINRNKAVLTNSGEDVEQLLSQNR